MKAIQQVFWPRTCIQLVVAFLDTLTPDEGLILLALGIVSILVCLGFAIWLVIA
jgi:type II secretory pathway component PulM